MTRDEGVALIQEQLGFRSDLATNIITNLKFAQITLEKGPTKPWFLVSEDSYIRTEAGEERLPLPSDFLQETDQAVLRYVPDDVSEETPERDLRKDDYDILRLNYHDITTGVIETGPPEAYALIGEYFRIFPTPDDDYLIRQIYYASDTELSSNIENQWMKYVPMLLIGKAGKQLASALRDSGALATFSQWEQEGRALLISQETDRDLTNRNLQVGGPQ